MCILALAWQVIDDAPMFLISNRDEFYQRCATPLQHWQGTSIFAGQDLEQGGTWLGITKAGRWAVITNVRDGADLKKYQTSRGALVTDFLSSEQTPIRFMQALEKIQNNYAGFNLIVGDQYQAVYMSNRGEAPQVLSRGVYVLSNGLMGEHWQKTAHLRKRFTQELLPLHQFKEIDQSTLINTTWDILEDQRKVALEDLPSTGIAIELEQLLSSTFIQSDVYGTRCSNYLLIKRDDIYWVEKTQQGNKQEVTFQILLHPTAPEI